MDIDILLALQSFREGPGAVFTEFLSKMTWFGEMNVVLVFMGLIYWCVSKEIGTYLLMGWSGNRIVNGVMKVSVCAYRPWIRDARIIPNTAAKASATGYSFPSGHSMNGASLFGGLAIRREIRGGLLGYYAVFLIINPLVKAAVTGVAGTIITCFLLYRIRNIYTYYPDCPDSRKKHQSFPSQASRSGALYARRPPAGRP